MSSRRCDCMGPCSKFDFLSIVPHEVWSYILWGLSVCDIGAAACCCRIGLQEVADPELWFNVFMRTCWPNNSALLAFAEGAATPSRIDWKARLKIRATCSPFIVVDMGWGYTKVALVQGVRGRLMRDSLPPMVVQLCSSPTTEPDCFREEQLTYIHDSLDRHLVNGAMDPTKPIHKLFHDPAAVPATGRLALLCNMGDPLLDNRVVCLLCCDDEGLWEVEFVKQRGEPNLRHVQPSTFLIIRRAADLPLFIGEPFLVTANRGDGDIGSSPWANAIHSDLDGRAGPVRIAPQAQFSLWAHGIDHGIVVNIGQSQTIALPVVNGEVVPEAACSSNVGSSSLTMVMMRILASRHQFVTHRFMTWCRDLKEMYCYVAPPSEGSLRSRLAAGDTTGIQRVQVPHPLRLHDTLELAEERVLVPEMLFDRDAGIMRPTLPELIVHCADQVLRRQRGTAEDVQRLLQQVVLVGGAADLPGIRARTEFEVRQILRTPAFDALRSTLSSPDDMYILNPPMGNSGPLTSPRYATLIGGCVRAASSAQFEASDAQGHTHSLHYQHTDELSFWGWRHMLDPRSFRTGGGGGCDNVCFIDE